MPVGYPRRHEGCHARRGSAAWIAVAIGATQVAPAVAPLDPIVQTLSPRRSRSGCLAGAAGFVVLARRRFLRPPLSTVPRRRLLARSVVLTAKSAEEEAIWRGLVLGALLRPLGPLGALTVSTLLFAGAPCASVRVGEPGRTS